MDDILKKTHKKNNIDLLKGRDTFFDKARNRKKWFSFTIVMPPIIASATYIPYVLEAIPSVEGLRDYIIGICTIIFVIIGEVILQRNERDLFVSNALREEYDIKVLGLPRNEFAFDKGLLRDDEGEWRQEIVDAWECRPDSAKYEVWYQEIFTDNKMANTLCQQMDNIIYTYHVYGAFKKREKMIILVESAIVFALLILSIFVWKDIQIFILIAFSLFGAFQSQLSEYKTITELINANSHLFGYVRNNSDLIKKVLADDNKGQVFLRSLQDIILVNREKSLFIPKRIRDKYLENGNEFYVQLDIIKKIYMDTPCIPHEARDIEILSGTSGEVTTTLDAVHERLLLMLVDVDKALRESQIKYILDGGSLIGACRDEKGFVFWDDDIDLALMIDDVDDAKTAIIEKFGDKYEIQDYENDVYYSPRLSTFRIREKNERSIVEEKDSELYEEYKNRGIFIDVYAYAPIVVNRTVDRFIRRLLIQGFNFKFFTKKWNGDKVSHKYNCLFLEGLYTKIRKEETDWKHDVKNRNNHFNKYVRLKEKYLKRVSRYLKLAKNKDYYAYVPNYIDDVYKPGPYIKGDFFDDLEMCPFEGFEFQRPKAYDQILEAYYGVWRKSPFKNLESLIDEGFSTKTFDVTALKHLKYIDKF